jgi:hypothetical protein
MEQAMKVETRPAQAGEESDGLEQAKQRFALWRASRKHGERISKELWGIALGLVERHGLQRVADELRVDIDVLKKRLAREVKPAPTTKAEPRFVEMFVPPAPVAAQTCECIVEMENARGAKMRIEFKGGKTAELMQLSNAFWSSAS